MSRIENDREGESFCRPLVAVVQAAGTLSPLGPSYIKRAPGSISWYLALLYSPETDITSIYRANTKPLNLI